MCRRVAKDRACLVKGSHSLVEGLAVAVVVVAVVVVAAWWG